jgi:ABC-type polar amino acid transport system ATPase subunit
MFQAREIWKSYSNERVLRGTSIAVSRGSATVLIGPSGSGKSTLLRTASLIDEPDRGSVEIDGSCCFDAEKKGRPSRTPWPDITVVLQQLFLWPHLTIRSNILLPAKLRGKPLGDLNNICSSLGIGNLLDRYPNEVSIGERQRAAVARALLLRPKYLLLDEITSSLDVEQIQRMLMLLDLKLQEGVGLIVVTHQLGFARNLMRKGLEGTFAFMDAGIISETGDINQFENPKTERLAKFRSAMLAIA